MKNLNLLVTKLQNTKEPISAQSCANILNVSESKFKAIIKDINSELNRNGAYIQGKTGLGNGYSLVITDNKKLDQFLNEIQDKQNEEYPSTQKERVIYIVQRLLQEKEYIKSEQFLDELYISNSQLSKDLKVAKEMLKRYGIDIISKPHYGSKIQFEEKDARKLLASLKGEDILDTLYSTSFIKDNVHANQDLAKIKAIITSECEKYNYQLNDFNISNLVTHMYIAMKRTEMNYLISFSEDEKENIKKTKEIVLAKNIIDKISETFNINFPEDEIYYVTIHLNGKRVVDKENLFDQELNDFINETLKKIDKSCMTNFNEDFSLQYDLSLHIMPLISRVQYGIEMRNPLLKEIKRRYIRSFDYAVLFAEEFNKKYKCSLVEDEIAYIALHFQVALNKKNEVTKPNALIVCSTGCGTANLLMMQFKKKYANIFGEINIMDALHYEKEDLSKWDYVFTTVPLPKRGPKVCQISYFLQEEDEKEIDRIIQKQKESSEFLKYCNEELYISKLKANSRDDALKAIVDNLKKYYDIPKTYLESLIKRENSASTCLVTDVAIPHPIKREINETFVSVVVLDERIQWDEENAVKVIILCNFAKGFAKENVIFFEELNKIIASKKTIKRISEVNNYQELCSAIREVDD